MCVCVCVLVCVYVCVCERERERVIACVSVSVCLCMKCVCVFSECVPCDRYIKNYIKCIIKRCFRGRQGKRGRVHHHLEQPLQLTDPTTHTAPFGPS